MNEDRRYWLAVASADHARRGREQGIMQVGHGKGGPLKRPRAGDGVVYYSPTVAMGGKERLQAFTSIGVVADDRVYQADMGGGFRPFRRDVKFVEATEASILPLLDPGFDTVGTEVNVRHLAATPPGMEVRFESEVIAVEDRKVRFKVAAFDEKEQIADGTHERFVVNIERFAKRLAEKRG
jgi:predicted thioesterase